MRSDPLDSDRLRRRGLTFSLSVLGAMILAGCDDSAPAIREALARARSSLAVQRFEPALVALEEVLVLDPDHVEANLIKSEILYHQGRLGPAAAILDRLRLAGCTEPRVRVGMAIIRKDQGRFEDSVALFESVPVSDRLPLPMAEALAGAGQPDRAANLVGQVLAADPWHPTAYELLSRVETQRGRTDAAQLWGDRHRGEERLRAVAAQARDLERQGDGRGAAVLRAQEYFDRGRWFRAIQLVRRLVESDPNQSKPLVLFGRIQAGMGQAARAVDIFQRALSLGDDPEVKSWLAAEQAVLAAGTPAPESLLGYAETQAETGNRSDARALALLVAEDNPRDLDAFGAVLRYFDRPEDGFVRLWARLRLRALQPGDRSASEAAATAAEALGIELLPGR